MYFCDYSHDIDDGSEFSDNWMVQLKYPAKLECTKEDLVKEFRSLCI